MIQLSLIEDGVARLEVLNDVSGQNFGIVTRSEALGPGMGELLVGLREPCDELFVGEECIVHPIVSDYGLLTLSEVLNYFSEPLFFLKVFINFSILFFS